MRALIYARYSTTLQSSLSIDDQMRVCRDRIAAEGWTEAGAHVDAAISGAVRDRPGLNALLAQAADADVVVAESLDRLSRDQEDIAAIFKRLAYAGVRIVTLSEGEIGELHIGLRGTMAAMMRKDTADKVRRGLTGRALAGRNPGGMAYGYRKVPRFDDRGEPIRGLREIDEDQAAIVRRIFDAYAAGHSARKIAEALNREGVLGPTGGLWRASSINGDPLRRNGILMNDLYRGRQIYNVTHRVYHPITRRREIRLNPESEWKVTDIPELRIVSDAQWEAAQAQRRDLSGRALPRRRRDKHLLSGKAVCGVCGANWRIIGTRRWGCSAHFDGRACTNGTTVSTAPFERRVLTGLSERLLTPDLVDLYVREWRAARAERLQQETARRATLERRAAAADAKVRRLVEALAMDQLKGMTELADALAAAKADAAEARAELASIDAGKVVALHPGLADDYRRRIADLTAALSGNDGDDSTAIAASHEARTAVRALISGITVTPSAKGRGVDIAVEGALANIIRLAQGERPEMYASAGAPGRTRTDTSCETRF